MGKFLDHLWLSFGARLDGIRGEVGIRLEVGEAPDRWGPLVGGSDEGGLGAGVFSGERRKVTLAGPTSVRWPKRVSGRERGLVGRVERAGRGKGKGLAG